MFDLSQISSYLVPSIVILCLCVGYVVKHLVPSDTANKYIPLIVAVVGLVAGIVSAVSTGSPITLDVIVGGLVSGLSSVGIQQSFKQLLESGDAVNGTPDQQEEEPTGSTMSD